MITTFITTLKLIASLELLWCHVLICKCICQGFLWSCTDETTCFTACDNTILGVTTRDARNFCSLSQSWWVEIFLFYSSYRSEWQKFYVSNCQMFCTWLSNSYDFLSYEKGYLIICYHKGNCDGIYLQFCALFLQAYDCFGSKWCLDCDCYVSVIYMCCQIDLLYSWTEQLGFWLLNKSQMLGCILNKTRNFLLLLLKYWNFVY